MKIESTKYGLLGASRKILHGRGDEVSPEDMNNVTRRVTPQEFFGRRLQRYDLLSSMRRVVFGRDG